jgi:hypothetical protein
LEINTKYFNEKQIIRLTETFKLLSSLFEEKTVISQITLKKRWRRFETKYDISNGNAKFEYRTVSYWKIHHKCQVGNDLA